MTREHVIPSFAYALQKTVESKIIGWNEVANRMVGGEAKVKDVCEMCNSGPLSVLDSYGKGLLESAGVLVRDYPKIDLTLEYDYDQLLRWLLKISFNSSRTDGAHSHLFEKYANYMLGRGQTPKRSEIAIIGYLAAPACIDTGIENLKNPFFVRISYGATNAFYTLRNVCFGPLHFFILVFQEDVLPGHAAAAIRRVIKIQLGAIELPSNRRMAVLHVGQSSWLDLYAAQAARLRHLGKSAYPG